MIMRMMPFGHVMIQAPGFSPAVAQVDLSRLGVSEEFAQTLQAVYEESRSRQWS